MPPVLARRGVRPGPWRPGGDRRLREALPLLPCDRDGRARVAAVGEASRGEHLPRAARSRRRGRQASREGPLRPGRPAHYLRLDDLRRPRTGAHGGGGSPARGGRIREHRQGELHEFAYGISSDNPHFGAVANPLAADRPAGGSSAGSAAAIAAGLADAALGSDSCARRSRRPPSPSRTIARSSSRSLTASRRYSCARPRSRATASFRNMPTPTATTCARSSSVAWR